MAHIILFHSILGRRSVEEMIALRFEEHGHKVTLPDLYDGHSAQNYDDGFALYRSIDNKLIIERAEKALATVPDDAVLSGVSFGAGIVSEFWAKRPLMKGALLFAGIAEWPKDLPKNMPVDAHIARPDPFDDEDYFEKWQSDAPTNQLHIYRYENAGHYFLDKTLSDFNAEASELCLQRSLEFLKNL